MTFLLQAENNEMIFLKVDNKPNAKMIFPASDDRPEKMFAPTVDNAPDAKTIFPASDDGPEKLISPKVDNQLNLKMIFPANDDSPEKMISPEDFAFLRMGATPTAHHATLRNETEEKKCFLNGAAVPVCSTVLSFSSFLASALERGKLLRCLRKREARSFREKGERGVFAS